MREYTTPDLDDIISYWDLPKNEAGTLKSACKNKYVVAQEFEDGRYVIGECEHREPYEIAFVDDANEVFIFTSKRAALMYIEENNMTSAYVETLRHYLFAE